MFLRLLELLFLVLVGTGLWTQVLWPLWTGRRLFPLLGPRGRVEAKLAREREDAELSVMARDRRHHTKKKED